MQIANQYLIIISIGLFLIKWKIWKGWKSTFKKSTYLNQIKNAQKSKSAWPLEQ